MSFSLLFLAHIASPNCSIHFVLTCWLGTTERRARTICSLFQWLKRNFTFSEPERDERKEWGVVASFAFAALHKTLELNVCVSFERRRAGTNVTINQCWSKIWIYSFHLLLCCCWLMLEMRSTSTRGTLECKQRRMNLAANPNPVLLSVGLDVRNDQNLVAC